MTNHQTTIHADDGLTIDVGGHTQVDGAVIASGTGNLSLSTGTLTVTDLQDHDRGSSLDVTVGGNFATGGGDGKGPKQPSTTPDGRPVGASISGQVADHDKEGVSRGTIGSGTITIRDPAHQTQDVASINRDPSQAQAVTKDTSSGVKFYGSTSSAQEIASGFQGIRQGAEQIGKAARDGFKDLPADVQAAVKKVGLAGRTVRDAIDAMVDEFVARGDITATQAEAASDLAQRALSDDETYNRLKSNGICLKQGFNFHEFLFTPAHAEAESVAACVAPIVVVAPEVALLALAIAGFVAVGVIIYNSIGPANTGPELGGRNSDPRNPDETLDDTPNGKG